MTLPHWQQREARKANQHSVDKRVLSYDAGAYQTYGGGYHHSQRPVSDRVFYFQKRVHFESNIFAVNIFTLSDNPEC